MSYTIKEYINFDLGRFRNYLEEDDEISRILKRRETTIREMGELCNRLGVHCFIRGGREGKARFYLRDPEIYTAEDVERVYRENINRDQNAHPYKYKSVFVLIPDN